MRLSRNRLAVAAVLLIATFPALGVAASPSRTPPKRTLLRVALFPYLPDAAADGLRQMALRIEAEFEAKNPTVDLVLWPMCSAGDLYDPELVGAWLKEGTEHPNALDGGLDLAEVDDVTLGALARTGALTEWPSGQLDSSFHPAGISASTIDGRLLGIPHWLCAHYVFSRNATVTSAGTSTELVQALRALGTCEVDLTGDFLGSYNLPSLYLDAYVDRHGELPPTVLTSAVDPDTVDDMKQVFQECEVGGANPCINSTHKYDENSAAAIEFAQGRADATFGYSERLHTILKEAAAAGKGTSISLAAAPLSAGRKPIVFVDSFVARRGCDGPCLKAAKAFVTFMTQVDTYAWIMMSDDAAPKARVPRYLLPARNSAFDHVSVRSDAYYGTLRTSLAGAIPFPSEGLLENKSALRKALLQRLCSTVAPDGKSCQ